MANWVEFIDLHGKTICADLDQVAIFEKQKDLAIKIYFGDYSWVIGKGKSPQAYQKILNYINKKIAESQ